MKRASLASAEGSVARSLDQVGGWWTLLIIHEAFLGTARFEHYQRRLGTARNILSARLDSLVAAEILERSAYQDRPVRMEYRLTDKGLDLFPVITALRQWGDKWLREDEPPLVLIHDCGREAWFVTTCSHCGGELTHRNTHPRRRAPT